MRFAQDAKRNPLKSFSAEEFVSQARRQPFLRIAKQKVRNRLDISGSSCVKDEDGFISTDNDGMKEVWRKYREELRCL